MHSKKLIVIATVFFAVILCGCVSQLPKKIQSETWVFDSLTNINGHPLEQMGQPKVVASPLGNAVSFDGDGDRLLINANPLGDATEFTIEIIFKANDVFPNNHEPRVFHIESPDNPARRITIELRLNDKKQWYFDGFIKSEKSQFTLIDPTKVHPIGEWAHAAITYKNREFISYVNGKKELTGEVDYLTIPANAKTSVGARMNQIHWFNGDVLQVRVTKKALQPREFLLLDKLEKVR
jgi:hypothetical protein